MNIKWCIKKKKKTNNMLWKKKKSFFFPFFSTFVNCIDRRETSCILSILNTINYKNTIKIFWIKCCAINHFFPYWKRYKNGWKWLQKFFSVWVIVEDFFFFPFSSFFFLIIELVFFIRLLLLFALLLKFFSFVTHLKSSNRPQCLMVISFYFNSTLEERKFGNCFFFF